MELQESIAKGASHLLRFQCDDGHFEGELSANTFPTCIYALAQMSMGRSVDADLEKWFIRNQNSEGYWGLDAAAPDTLVHTGSGVLVFIVGFSLLLISAKALKWQS